MNITQGPAITKFSALFDIAVEEVIEWVSGYVNRPESEFPDLVERGMVDPPQSKIASNSSFI